MICNSFLFCCILAALKIMNALFAASRFSPKITLKKVELSSSVSTSDTTVTVFSRPLCLLGYTPEASKVDFNRRQG
jgi:hypothetical protein